MTTSSTMHDCDTIYYDASCGLCSAGRRRLRRLVGRRGFVCRPLQSQEAAEVLNLPAGQIPEEVKLRTRDGRILGGVDALLHVVRRVWWVWPIAVIAELPLLKPLMRRTYRWIARSRYVISRSCRLRPDAGIF